MATYFIEYLVSTDHKTHAFFGSAPDEKSDDDVKKIIIDGLKKAYGESLLDVEITKQATSKKRKIDWQQKKLDEEATQ